jgi:hypothetical protein
MFVGNYSNNDPTLCIEKKSKCSIIVSSQRDVATQELCAKALVSVSIAMLRYYLYKVLMVSRRNPWTTPRCGSRKKFLYQVYAL